MLGLYARNGHESPSDHVARLGGVGVVRFGERETILPSHHAARSDDEVRTGLSAIQLPEPLGLRSGEVVVVPHDSRWADLFELAAAEISRTLRTSVLAVHHVGSTSVPGLCAKPVLDLLVSVPDLERALELVPALESLGYEYRPEEDIPDRHYFRRGHGATRTHHLSLAEPDSRHHRVTLAFRDALRADPAVRAAYAELKIALARRHPRDRAAYLEGKAGFINQVLAAAGERLRR